VKKEDCCKSVKGLKPVMLSVLVKHLEAWPGCLRVRLHLADAARPFASTLWVTTIAIATFFIPTARADEAGNMQNTTTKTMETFVPPHRVDVASVELLPEITSNSNEVTLKQLCNWPEGDSEVFAEFADLIIVRFEKDAAFTTIGVEQIQSILRDAGMNPASVNFSGAASCRVVRGDVKIDEAQALRDWMTDAEATTAIASNTRTTTQAAPSDPPGVAKGDNAPSKPDIAPELRDLRARLIYDLSQRISISVDRLQVEFSAEDQKVLALPNSPSVSVEPQRANDLGNISWLVTTSLNGEAKRVRIAARARAWVDQVVCSRPLGLRQTISEADIETKRVLTDRLPQDALVTAEQVIGQQAARDLKVGSVITGKLLAPVELVRPGQLVTVFMRRGAIEVKSVARALQAGSAGQSVKVKNEATGDLFQVTLVGPQTAVLTGSDPVADISH
jgi:flagella basal body P-ring formation protein FlgA